MTPASGPVSTFIDRHFRHFNAAVLKDAADAYTRHLDNGGQMLITLAGAMSTAELGLSLAEMIRRGKVHAISCTGANLEEDLFNLVAHSHYERVPHYRYLTAEDEQRLLDRNLNRVTDTCITEEESMRRIERLGTNSSDTTLAGWYQATSANTSIGFFQIGGGIAGDFPICVVPMLHQDLRVPGVPLWGYFCQISDSTTSYGSYSGAVPNEKITWGKLAAETPKFVIESDATIVAPLVFAKVLGW